jgi:cyclophilin family peptidyl-prolyl cis-trans isomerase
VVVASGGRRWGEVVEADAIADALARAGVPRERIVKERLSLSTRENARFTAAAFAKRGIGSPVAVVTCAWHLRRALVLFERQGLSVVGIAAEDAPAPAGRRVWRWGRERVMTWVALLVLAACSKGTSMTAAPADAGDASALAPDVVAIARAEDARRARDVPDEALRSHDATVRRRAARALARILDDGDPQWSDAALLRLLEDDDDETLAWGAYGLGESCKGREEAHVRALAARLGWFTAEAPPNQPVDGRAAIMRALGRCGGDVAEQTLRAWVRRGGMIAESAAFAIGDAAAKRGALTIESAALLLDMSRQAPHLDACLAPFGRVESSPTDDLDDRLASTAKLALSRSGPLRIFAVRALGRSGSSDVAADLGAIVASDAFTPAERAEAARALGRLHRAGQLALGDAILAVVPAKAEALSGDVYGVLSAAVAAVDDDLAKKTETALWSVTKLEAAGAAARPLAHRVSALRCAAAAKLARGAYDSDIIRGCDVDDGESGERARLAALDHGALSKKRRAAWAELAHSKHVRVREAALEAIERHAELGDGANAVLADAIADASPGIVKTAADVVHAHPDRLMVLSESEKKAALDPRAPPPTTNPAMELDKRVARALVAALSRKWPEDAVEARISVMDAAIAAGVDGARENARVVCRESNVTLRARAALALAAAGEKGATCPPPEDPPPAAPELDAPLPRPVRIAFDTDAPQSLVIAFDPSMAPVAATRFAELARAGFFTGIAVHRVVPGFVVQLGDPGGDSYGGNGKLLRCETSPVSFAPHDVGVALAGRDTGSSQIFVTLAPTPHLDGEYAWVGRAEGDWDAVAEGDIVKSVRVEP